MSLKRNVTVPTGRLAIGSIVYNNVKKAGKPPVVEASLDFDWRSP